MGFIRQMLNNTEKAITRKVVEGKVKSFIDGFSQQMDETNNMADDANVKIAKSTGVIAEIVDESFNVFIEGFKSLNTIVTNSIQQEQSTITDLITSNKDNIVTIITALKMMDNEANRTAIKSLAKAFEPYMTYLNEDFTDLLDKVSEEKVQPKVTKLANIWGINTNKWYIINTDGDIERVSEEEYNDHKDAYKLAYGHWYETKTLFKTYQSTEKQFNRAKENGHKKTDTFYSDLGINTKKVKF